MLTIRSQNFNNINSYQTNSRTNIAFGTNVVPVRIINKRCDSALKKVEMITDWDSLIAASSKFFDKMILKVLRFKNPRLNDSENGFIRLFRHELINKIATPSNFIKESFGPGGRVVKKMHPEIQTDDQFYNYQKNEFKRLVNVIKSTTNEWNQAEKFEKDAVYVPFNSVFDRLMNIATEMNSPQFDVVGKELLEKKKVMYPGLFRSMASQPFLNAIKYGEGKPFQVIFEHEKVNGQDTYWASFINPNTKPVPDAEIDKISEGKRHRAAGSKIQGTGEGFAFLVEALKKFGFESHIPNMIEKGREKGFCVKIPLIGITD